MTMDLLGTNIGSLIKKFGKLSLKTVLILANQILKRIEALHTHNFIHRDIKVSFGMFLLISIFIARQFCSGIKGKGKCCFYD